MKNIEPQAFAGMVTEWKTCIDNHLNTLKITLMR